jgi:glycosyltransferase involved in cell wall biosynthesis
MRILQVTTMYYPELQFGGPPQKIHAFSRGMTRRGHEVRTVTLHSQRRGACEQVTHDDIAVQYMPWLGVGGRQVPYRLGVLEAAVQWAQVVHVYGLYNLLGPAAAFFAQRGARPLVLEPLGMYVPRTRHVRLKQWYHRLFTTRLLRQAAVVIATSPAEQAELAAHVETARLVLRQNMLDVEQYRHLPDRLAFRKARQIAADERQIIYVGRISPIKNLVALVQAFGEAALARTRLLLIGPQLEPDYAAEVQDTINWLGLAERVQLIGPLYAADKLAALAAADLLVLPSTYESFGNAAAEAVAAGIPVLLSDTCGIAPLINERAGLAVPPTVDGLAAGLQVMLTDHDRRAQVMQQREAVLAELAGDQPVQQMEQIYQQILAEHSNVTTS